MKLLSRNNLGKKYLVEDCQKIKVEAVVKQARKEVIPSLIKGLAEINGCAIQLIGKKLHHGGNRLWFVCPLCGLASGVIYKHPVKNSLIGCRICLNLEYRSRRYKGMVENNAKM